MAGERVSRGVIRQQHSQKHPTEGASSNANAVMP